MPRIYCRLLIAAALAACTRGAERAADTGAAVPSADTASARPTAAPMGLGPCAPASGRDSLCFRASRTYDFAGDGRPFTLTVDARGPAPDSLRVALRVARGDTVYYRADWSTALYGRYDARAVSPDSARRRAEAQLARLLADSAFRPTRAFLGGASDADAMLRETIAFDVNVAEERRRRGLSPADTLPVAARESPAAVSDSARVRSLTAELRDAPAYRYYAGGEASYAIAWSRAERRFVVVFACC